jgi:hypothetical protein
MVDLEIDFPKKTIASRCQRHAIVHAGSRQTQHLGRADGADPVTRVSTHRVGPEFVHRYAGGEAVSRAKGERRFRPGIGGWIRPPGGRGEFRPRCDRLAAFLITDVSTRFRGVKRLLPGFHLLGRGVVSNRAIDQDIGCDQRHDEDRRHHGD